MKKILSLLLALSLVMGLSVTAFADELNIDDHQFVAYQIFKGTQSTTSESAQLGDIEWGSGINSVSFLTSLQENFGDTFDTCKTPADVAEVISAWKDNAEEAKKLAEIAYRCKSDVSTPCQNNDTVLPAGYYLVVDVTDFDENAVNTGYNLALLQLTKKDSFEIKSKSSVPVVQKKVKDVNDSEANSTSDWQDSADYDINDNVPFQLTATLADNVAEYVTYKIVFHDTLSAGLTYKGDAVVTFKGKNVTSHFDIEHDNGNLTISCDNVKDFGATNNDVITVEYTAELNGNAAIGSLGNPNEVYLEYSNNPNDFGVGNEDTGNTPKDKVIVFTYKVVVNKVDENEEPLAGAGFTLYKWTVDGVYQKDADGNIVTDDKDNYILEDGWVAIGGELTGGELTTFEWKGLDDGKYKLVETTTPAGYNTIQDIEFTIAATHDVEADDPKLLTLTGNGFTGVIDFEAGTLTGEVINETGSILPETGGIGTTIFYALGAIMVIGAGVLLIAKKRMSNEV